MASALRAVQTGAPYVAWAFGIGKFGATEVISASMIFLGLVCAYAIIRAIHF